VKRPPCVFDITLTATAYYELITTALSSANVVCNAKVIDLTFCLASKMLSSCFLIAPFTHCWPVV